MFLYTRVFSFILSTYIRTCFCTFAKKLHIYICRYVCRLCIPYTSSISAYVFVCTSIFVDVYGSFYEVHTICIQSLPPYILNVCTVTSKYLHSFFSICLWVQVVLCTSIFVFILKGQCHEIFYLWFFSSNNFSWPQ
jgi:hypothetical protein